MQAITGKLTGIAGRRTGQGRNVDVGNARLPAFILGHGVELVDFNPSADGVVGLFPGKKRLAPVWN